MIRMVIKMILGSHVNFGSEQLVGCVKQALSYGANTFMFYTGAPQNTIRKKLEEEKIIEAKKLMQENGIELKNVICHAPYIINLANNESIEKWQFSISFLKQELERCKELEISYIVVHPGSSVGIERNQALQNISDALNLIIKEDSPMILLETMAGKGTECGQNITELKTILNGVTSKNIGVCLDTCHLNDSGIDMNKFDDYLNLFDKEIGLDKIHCIHINDSKNPLGAKKDRHENIGYGTIGFDTLLKIINHQKLTSIPKILETPYVDKLYPPYKQEIDSIKAGKKNEHLLEDIREYYK